MFTVFTARPDRVRAPAGRGAALRRAGAAFARELDAAFEALARSRYDAPWQRVAEPRSRDR